MKKFLSQEFEMKDLGQLTYFLGIQVMRDCNKGTISLGQPKYIAEILKSFNMENCKLVVTPLETSSKLCKPLATRTPEDIDAMKRVPYRELVDSLMYVMVATKPDLSNAVSIISQFMQDPSLEHWVAATRILRYLQGTQDLWLQYSRVPIDKVTLTGFSNSDWGGDIETRRSITGLTFLLANGAVSWMNKK